MECVGAGSCGFARDGGVEIAGRSATEAASCLGSELRARYQSQPPVAPAAHCFARRMRVVVSARAEVE